MLYSLRYILLGVLLMTSSAWGKEVNHEQHLERRSVRVECADLPCASVDTFDLTADLSPCDTVVIMRRRTSRAQADADMSESRIQDNRDRGSPCRKRACVLYSDLQNTASLLLGQAPPVSLPTFVHRGVLQWNPFEACTYHRTNDRH